MSSISKIAMFLSVLSIGFISYLGLKHDPEKVVYKNKMTTAEIMTALRTKVISTANDVATLDLEADDNNIRVQCLSDEMDYLNIQRQVLIPLKNGLKLKNTSTIAGILTDDAFLHDFNSQLESSIKDLDGITNIKFEKPAGIFSKNDSLDKWNKFLASYENIEFAEISGEKYFSPPNTRSKNRKMNNVTVWARYDLRGRTANNEKMQDRGTLAIKVRLTNNNEWKAYKVEILNRERLATSRAFFNDVTKASKIVDYVPNYLRREAIRRGGYAMAIGDYNNDDSVDLYVATVAESILLKGHGPDKFSIDPQVAMRNKSLVKAAAFADFDNNGTDELLMVRFAPNEAQTKNDRSDIQILNNINGRFELKQGVVNFEQKTAYAMPLALADFNGDNKLDFYVGFPGAKDFTTLEPAIHAKDLATQGVFYNDGKGSFKDDSYRSFASAYKENSEGQYDDMSKLFPHAALAADYNNDGNTDLIVIDDRGNLSPIYENKGQGKFAFSANKIGVGLNDYGMGAEVGDLNGDGRSDFLMSSVNFNSSERIKKSCEMNWSTEGFITAGTAGLRMFEGNPNGTFSDVTAKNGLDWVGEGAGGVTLIDYNNDGHQDIYLVNGLWTGTESDQSQDISSYFVAASSLGIIEDQLKSNLRSEDVIYESIKGSDFNALLFRSDSQSAIMDVLSFFRGDVHSSKAIEGREQSPSLAGAQRNRLFRNNGDGTYTEVGYMLGVDSIADGYMAATADLDKDGNMDLVLRNADPGFSTKQFDPVQIFRNSDAYKKSSVVLSLKGTNSNTNAVGAKVVAKIGDKTLHRELIGNKGTVQSERLIHIGLNKALKVDQLDIIWPSGQKQALFNVKAGFHKIVEPETVKSKSMALK